MVGALVVSQFGLLQYRPSEKLEKIVFNPAGLTAAGESAHRVETAHSAIHELLAAQDAEVRRQAAPLEKEMVSPPRVRTATPPQDKRKTAAPKRDLAATPAIVAPPLVITPTATTQADAGSGSKSDGREDLFDKLAAGVTKLRKLIVETMRVETSLHLPFEGTSAASGAIPALDDLHHRLKLPSFGL
jgi:hypothetical protein